MGHYILNFKLNGARLDTKRISQPQISSIALLLVTSFKAAVTASVGSCFVQHLWFVLRGPETPISLVEQLFVFRNNVLAMGNWRAVWRAPILFLMALYIWCIGIAMAYPPGSLTVMSLAHKTTDSREVTTFNPQKQVTFNKAMLEKKELWPTIAQFEWRLNFNSTRNTVVYFNYM